MSRHGHRKRRPPEVLAEALLWGLVSCGVALVVMVWSGVPWQRVALLGLGLCVLVVLPLGVLKGTGTRLGNLEALAAGEAPPPPAADTPTRRRRGARMRLPDAEPAYSPDPVHESVDTRPHPTVDGWEDPDALAPYVAEPYADPYNEPYAEPYAPVAPAASTWWPTPEQPDSWPDPSPSWPASPTPWSEPAPWSEPTSWSEPTPPWSVTGRSDAVGQGDWRP